MVGLYVVFQWWPTSAVYREKICFSYVVQCYGVYLFKAFLSSLYIASPWMLILCHKSITSTQTVLRFIAFKNPFLYLVGAASIPYAQVLSSASTLKWILITWSAVDQVIYINTPLLNTVFCKCCGSCYTQISSTHIKISNDVRPSCHIAETLQWTVLFNGNFFWKLLFEVWEQDSC